MRTKHEIPGDWIVSQMFIPDMQVLKIEVDVKKETWSFELLTESIKTEESGVGPQLTG